MKIAFKKFKEELRKLIKNKKFKIYTKYTIVFCIIMIFLLGIFYCQNKSMIWKSDALKQHFVILKDFNEIIKEFLNNPSLNFQQISFNIGLGEDIIGQYSYYILGDPFAYLSLLFPSKYLEIAYIFSIILRMYFVGVSFIIFGNYKKLKDLNIVIGALIYTFSGFVLFSGVRHPYFLNPVILFPLLLIAVDLLFKKNKKIPLLILTFISLVSNYYFFYMLTILIGIYILLKFFFEYKENGYKYLFKIVVKVLLIYFIAFLMASVIFLPTLYAFFNSSRIDVSNFQYYSLTYYLKLFNGLITTEGSNWNIYGISSIILLMIPILIKNIKKYKVLMGYLIIMGIILLFPHLGSLMNGFSFPTNRWIFAFSFLLAYTVALFLDLKFKYTKKEIKSMALVLSLYYIILVFTNKTITKELVVMISFTIMALTIIIYNKELRKIKISPDKLLILIVILNLMSLTYYLYSPAGNRKYAKDFLGYKVAEKSYNTMNNSINNYKDTIDEIKKDNSIYRISNFNESLPNYSIFHNIMGISSFLSIGSKYEAMLAKELKNSQYEISRYIKEFDNRTRITTLLGVKYFITNKSNISVVPYNYSLYKEINDALVYKNNQNIGLGVFYTSYILKNNYDKLSPLDKEQSIIQNVTLNKDIKNYKLKKQNKVSNSSKINYQIIDKSKILDKNKIITNKYNQSITLKYSDNLINNELYLIIEGLSFKQSKTSKNEMNYTKKQKDISYQLNFSNGNIKKQKIFLLPQKSPYYVDNSLFYLNLGSVQSKSKEIEINFVKKGEYTFSKIYLVAVDMEKYDKSMEKLKENKFHITKFEANNIYGEIKTNKDGVLQLSTLYSKGWNAYVDDKKTEVLNVNTTFIGVPLKAGKHKINFKYKTPYLTTGIVFSILGTILFITLIIYEKKKNN